MRGETSIPDSLLKISTKAIESNFRNLDKKSCAPKSTALALVMILRNRTSCSKAVSVNSAFLSNNPKTGPKQ